MRSPLGPTLVNVFMCSFENIKLENCPSYFKPIIYRQFFHDMFLLVPSNNHVEKFKYYLKKYKNITFTSEVEESSSRLFLDITISHECNKFVASVYCKPTFSEVFTNFEGLIRDMHKLGLIEAFLQNI